MERTGGLAYCGIGEPWPAIGRRNEWSDRIRRTMRANFFLLTSLSFLVASGQNTGPDERMANVQTPAAPKPDLRRWSGAGGSFGPGQPIAPLPMRAITWEFGDGSRSDILPPRPWQASDAVEVEQSDMSPFNERAGGSPCVLSCATPAPNGPDDPQAYVVSGNGELTLVTTGLGSRELRIHLADGVRPRLVILERCFTSGRWPLPSGSTLPGPRFITLQDVATGEVWCAGVGL